MVYGDVNHSLFFRIIQIFELHLKFHLIKAKIFKKVLTLFLMYANILLAFKRRQSYLKIISDEKTSN